MIVRSSTKISRVLSSQSSNKHRHVLCLPPPPTTILIFICMIVLPVSVVVVVTTTMRLETTVPFSSSIDDSMMWTKMLQQVSPPPPPQHNALQQQQQEEEQRRRRPRRRQEAPYNQFCETTPRNELQLWNTRKKVISFALFTSPPPSPPPSASSAQEQQQPQPLARYFLDGLKANVRLSQLYFPEWVTRVYTFNLSEQEIQRLIDVDPIRVEVVKCHDDSIMNQLDNARRMISRFLVVDDPTVEFALVRDVDSRPTVRELLAVNEWMSSGLKFHTIRDHLQHRVPVMGGMFGMRRGLFDDGEKSLQLTNLVVDDEKTEKTKKEFQNTTTTTTTTTSMTTTSMTDIVSKAFELYPTRRIPGTTQDDQNFLQKFIWKLVKDDAMDHDMDGGRRCKTYESKVCRRFPIEDGRDDYSFVGYPFNPSLTEGNELNIATSHFECSMSCRAEYNEEYQDVLISNQRPHKNGLKFTTKTTTAAGQPEKQIVTTKISGRASKRLQHRQ